MIFCSFFQFFVGGEDLIKKIKEGFTDFEICIATPNMMSKINAIAKVLGPKGLMPDVKIGTISDDITVAIEKNKKGQLLFKVDKAGIVHCSIGKVEFTEEMLAENLRALITEVVKAKPSSAKGKYLKKISLSSSMGPSLLVDQATYS